MELAYPGEQRVTADGVWVGVTAVKRKAGLSRLTIGAYRISSTIGRSAVAYCAALAVWYPHWSGRGSKAGGGQGEGRAVGQCVAY